GADATGSEASRNRLAGSGPARLCPPPWPPFVEKASHQIADGHLEFRPSRSQRDRFAGSVQGARHAVGKGYRARDGAVSCPDLRGDLAAGMGQGSLCPHHGSELRKEMHGVESWGGWADSQDGCEEVVDRVGAPGVAV